MARRGMAVIGKARQEWRGKDRTGTKWNGRKGTAWQGWDRSVVAVTER
jgi:hypothetical protein